MNEDGKLIIDVRKLLPQVAKRIAILESLYRNWESVVGHAAANYSKPYDFIKNDLYIAVNDNATAHIISNMKGTISRALANRYGWHEDINLKITIWDNREDKAQPVKSNAKSKQTVNVSASLVSEYMSECPDTLPSDAKLAMSHFMAYLESVKQIKSSD